MEHHGSWDKNLLWAEFSYNNSYQQSLKMAPFEVLYGCQCRTPLNWIEPGEKVIFGPDHIYVAEATVSRIQDNLKDARSHQESYANKRHQPLEYEVGDHVYLQVSLKGVKKFGMKGKLAPRYIEHFPILEKCGPVAYKMELPPYKMELPLKADLTYPKHPIKILDQKDHVTRRKTIKFFKMQWSNHSEEEATWESEAFLLAIQSLS
jgi:hypothetical protein